MNDEEILQIARKTIGQGSFFGRSERLTLASDPELLDFARTVFSDYVKEVCERVNIHTLSTQQISKIRSAIRAGIKDENLGKLVREICETKAENE